MAVALITERERGCDVGVDSQKARDDRGRNSCDPRPGDQQVPATSGQSSLPLQPSFQVSSLGRDHSPCFKVWVSGGMQTSETNVLAERESAFFSMRSEGEKQKRKQPRGNIQLDLKGLRDSNLEQYRRPSEEKERSSRQKVMGGGAGALSLTT